MSIIEEEARNYDLKYKIIALGESKVGKNGLIKRFTKDQFGGAYLTTIGLDFQEKTIQIEDKKVKLQVWDTAGQERFRNVAKIIFNQVMDSFLYMI